MNIFEKMTERKNCIQFLDNAKWHHWEFNYVTDDHFPDPFLQGVCVYTHDLTEREIGIFYHYGRKIRYCSMENFSMHGNPYLFFPKESEITNVLPKFYSYKGIEKYQRYEKEINTYLISETEWKYWYSDKMNDVDLYYIGKDKKQKDVIEEVKRITRDLHNVKYDQDPIFGTLIVNCSNITSSNKSICNCYKTPMLEIVEKYPNRKGFIA